MRVSSLLGAAALALPAVNAIPTLADRQSCTADSAVVRKEWSNMSRSERIAYTSGIQCLMSLPSRFPAGVVPAAETYYDDFTAVHVNMSMSIHLSGIFLSWHREFIHLVETALHEKCEYPADLGVPYWDWLKYPVLDGTALFDGSDESLGGNGMLETNPQPIEIAPGFFIPHGTGGDCVVTGPFANMTIRFGPFSPLLISQGVPADWDQPKPHCFTRDLNAALSTTHMNIAYVTLLQTSVSIEQFQHRLEPETLGETGLGLHRVGHLMTGGPMSDFFSSPQDPAFFLHHSQIDRMWTQWKAVDSATRQYQYNGTSTMNNPPGLTPEVTNSTTISFGILGESMTLAEAADNMGGKYCYRYE